MTTYIGFPLGAALPVQSPGCQWDTDGLIREWEKNGHFTDHSCAYSLSSLKSPY